MSWPLSTTQEPAINLGNAAPLLEVTDLRTHFATDDGAFRAVDGISFTLLPGRTLGVVGESGCGKSVTALSIMGLVPQPGRIAGGAVRFEGTDLLALPAAKEDGADAHRTACHFWREIEIPEATLAPESGLPSNPNLARLREFFRGR